MTDQDKDQDQTPRSPASGNKPVVVYIMILFIAAFLLMALSLFMHQRSSNEVVGELKNSVSALQEVQELQNQVIQLQKALDEAEDTAESFQDATETAREQASHMEHLLEESREALDWFWQLNEAYVQGDLARCRELVESQGSAQSPLSDSLPEDSAAAARYQEILAALDAQEDQEFGGS